MDRRGLVVAALAFLVVIGGSPGGVDAKTGGTASSVTGPPPVATDAFTDSSTPVEYTYRRLPEHPNEIEATVRVPDTSELDVIEVDLQRSMTASSTDGFERESGVYVWDGETDSPTLTYRMNVANSLGSKSFEGGHRYHRHKALRHFLGRGLLLG